MGNRVGKKEKEKKERALQVVGAAMVSGWDSDSCTFGHGAALMVR